jgi:hypothetical protein
MRLTPGGPLPGGAPTRVTDGEYVGFEGTVVGHIEEDGKLPRYRVVIKRPEEAEGMEFDTYVPAHTVAFQGRVG